MKQAAQRPSRRFPNAPRQVFRPEIEKCPYCSQTLRSTRNLYIDREVQRMDGPLNVRAYGWRCVADDCPRADVRYRARQQLWHISLPRSGYGLDVVAYTGWQRDQEFRQYREIQKDLQERGIMISERHVGRLYRHYLALLGGLNEQRLDDLKEVEQKHGGVVWALDALQPDQVGSQLYVLYEAISEQAVGAAWLDKRDSQHLIGWLQAYTKQGLTVLGTLSDGEEAEMIALKTLFPEAAHQMCLTHFLGDCAKPIKEADQKLKAALRQEMGRLPGVPGDSHTVANGPKAATPVPQKAMRISTQTNPENLLISDDNLTTDPDQEPLPSQSEAHESRTQSSGQPSNGKESATYDQIHDLPFDWGDAGASDQGSMVENPSTCQQPISQKPSFANTQDEQWANTCAIGQPATADSTSERQEAQAVAIPPPNQSRNSPSIAKPKLALTVHQDTKSRLRGQPSAVGWTETRVRSPWGTKNHISNGGHSSECCFSTTFLSDSQQMIEEESPSCMARNEAQSQAQFLAEKSEKSEKASLASMSVASQASHQHDISPSVKRHPKELQQKQVRLREIELLLRRSFQDALRRPSRYPNSYGGLAGYEQISGIVQALREQLQSEPQNYLHSLLAQAEKALHQTAALAKEVRKSQKLLIQLTNIFFEPFHEPPAAHPDCNASLPDWEPSPCDKSGAEVKREVKHLLQQARENKAQTTSCRALILQTERLLAQWEDSLFNCYDIPALPPNNAKLESRFNRLRSAQRRISGRKKTAQLRRDAHLRLLLQANSKEELLEQFRRVSENSYLRARFRVEAAEEPLRQLARLRRKPYQTASALIAEYLALCKQDHG